MAAAAIVLVILRSWHRADIIVASRAIGKKGRRGIRRIPQSVCRLRRCAEHRTGSPEIAQGDAQVPARKRERAMRFAVTSGAEIKVEEDGQQPMPRVSGG